MAPASARPRATSYPIPPDAPVMMIVLPSKRKDSNMLSLIAGSEFRIDLVILKNAGSYRSRIQALEMYLMIYY